MLFGYLTGMRRGEIASLEWADVDGDTIRLRAENAKTGEGRTLPIVGELAELIARRREARQVKVKGTVVLANLIFHRGSCRSRSSASPGRALAVRPASGNWFARSAPGT